MTSQAFEAALSEPDNNASHLHLQKLIAARDFSNFEIPAVAGNYLSAFCDIDLSFIWRRWIGLALAGMIEASMDVVEYLKRQRHELQRLGVILLSNMEREDTKIIAGIIVRQALERGIENTNFWESDKVRNSMPKFPENCGPRWMANLQNFLDTMVDLALADSNADPSIIYPISLVASDGFKWREPSDSVPIALLQTGLLTFIAPDSYLHTIQFVDIPIAHIRSMRSQPSILHASQAQTTGHEPWDLILSLNPGPWTYCLDSSKRTGTEITLLFQHSGDAGEWENCIKEHLKWENECTTALPTEAHPLMSSSPPIDVGPAVPPQTNQILVQHEQGIHVQLDPSVRVSCSQKHIQSRERINASRSGMSSLSPQVKAHKGEDLYPGRVGQCLQSNKAVSCSVPVETTQLGAEEEERKNTALQGQNRTKVAQVKNKSRASATRQEDESLLIPNPNQQPLDSEPFGTNSAQQTTRTRPPTKRTTYRKGKLPSVSQAVKANASGFVHTDVDVFEIPNERRKEPNTPMEASTNDTSSPTSKSQTQLSEVKTASHPATTCAKESKSRSRRKLKIDDDDEDEFIPDERKRTRKTASKRKSELGIVGVTERAKKKSRIGPPQNAIITTCGTGVVKSKQPAVQHNANIKPENESPNDHFSSVVSSRHSLIAGLLGSRRLSQAAVVPFKRPMRPSRAPQTPSIPLKSKIRFAEPPMQPQTPMSARKRLNGGLFSHVTSSPPLGNSIKSMSIGAPTAAGQTEILSSNSKPVPASPNAESTAISGHADRDDVEFEKEKGEIQTAKSDPFGQRRGGQKSSSFTRRLTGEDIAHEQTTLKESDSHILPVGSASLGSLGIDAVVLAAESQHSSECISWQDNTPTRMDFQNSSGENVTRATAPCERAARARMKQQEVLNSPEHVSCLSKFIDLQASPLFHGRTKTRSHIKPVKSPPYTVKRRVLTKAAPVKSAFLYKESERVIMENPTSNVLQQTINTTKTEKPIQNCDDDVGTDGETVLINYEELEHAAVQLKASSLILRSSPPLPASPSSHSSTSAESNRPPVRSSEAEEIEWEASLQPHQRALHDLVMRTTKRVLRHIVDNETAVSDIVDMFAKDGEYMLESWLRRHDAEYNIVFQDMENKIKELKKDLGMAVKQLKERRRLNAMT